MNHPHSLVIGQLKFEAVHKKWDFIDLAIIIVIQSFRCCIDLCYLCQVRLEQRKQRRLHAWIDIRRFSIDQLARILYMLIFQCLSTYEIAQKWKLGRMFHAKRKSISKETAVYLYAWEVCLIFQLSNQQNSHQFVHIIYAGMILEMCSLNPHEKVASFDGTGLH